MASTHKGLGLVGDFGENEVDWGGYRNEGIAAQSHMSYPSLTINPLNPRLNPGTASDGQMFIVGTGSSWGTFPVDPSNPTASRSTVGHIAVRDLSRWYFHRVRPGVIVHAQDTNRLYLRNNTGWELLTTTAHTPQDFNYNSLTNKPAAYSPPDPMWYKTWNNGNHAITNSNLLSSLSSSLSSSSSSSKIFDSNGRCISPGFYDIRYQVQAASRVNSYGKLDLQIKVGNNIIVESAIAFADLDNSPFTHFVQCITEINQNDIVYFDQVVNSETRFQLLGGQSKTFATIHRIR